MVKHSEILLFFYVPAYYSIIWLWALPINNLNILLYIFHPIGIHSTSYLFVAKDLLQPLFNALMEHLNFPPPSPLLFLLKSEFEAPSWDSISVLRVLVVEILWGWFMARVRVVTFLDFITAWVNSAITLKAAKSQQVFQIKPIFH